MESSKKRVEFRVYDTSTAQAIARAMVHREAARPGGQPRALAAIERRHGIRASQIRELLSRPNRTLVARLWHPLVSAYQEECERQIRLLEVEVEKAKQLAPSNPENLRRAEALVAEARREIGIEKGK